MRLAFIDLDGTLLGPDRTVSAENADAVARLRAEGFEIVLASGRHHRNILALANIGAPGWILSSHGVVVRHARTDEVLLEMGIPFAHVVAARALAPTMSLIAYHRDSAFIERRTRWTDLYAEKTGWDPPIRPFESLAPDGFQKVLLSDDPARIAQLHAALPEDTVARHHAVITEPELLELLAHGANKATGAAALAARIGARAEEALAFGDGNNDVELLAWAGRSVAMDHGRESARRAAKRIAPPGPPETAFARAVALVLST